MIENYKIRLAAATIAAISVLFCVDGAMGSVAVDDSSISEESMPEATCNVDNQLLNIGPGRLSAASFSNVLKSRKIKGLTIRGTTIDVDTAGTIARAIETEKISKLSLAFCNMPYKALSAILAACCNAPLESLQIFEDTGRAEGVPFRQSVANQIAALMRNTRTLTSIELVMPRIGNEEARVIRAALAANSTSENPTLETFSLRANISEEEVRNFKQLYGLIKLDAAGGDGKPAVAGRSRGRAASQPAVVQRRTRSPLSRVDVDSVK